MKCKYKIIKEVEGYTKIKCLNHNIEYACIEIDLKEIKNYKDKYIETIKIEKKLFLLLGNWEIVLTMLN